MGFDAREFTPRVIRKITVLAAEVRSFQRATIVLKESDVSVSAKTVQRVVHEVGQELVERRDSKQPQQRLAKPPENVPALAVVECETRLAKSLDSPSPVERHSPWDQRPRLEVAFCGRLGV